MWVRIKISVFSAIMLFSWFIHKMKMVDSIKTLIVMCQTTRFEDFLKFGGLKKYSGHQKI
jgi:hypothetical protein